MAIFNSYVSLPEGNHIPCTYRAFSEIYMGNDAFGSIRLGGVFFCFHRGAARKLQNVGDFSQCTRTACIDYSIPLGNMSHSIYKDYKDTLVVDGLIGAILAVFVGDYYNSRDPFTKRYFISKTAYFEENSNTFLTST